MPRSIRTLAALALVSALFSSSGARGQTDESGDAELDEAVPGSDQAGAQADDASEAAEDDSEAVSQEELRRALRNAIQAAGLDGEFEPGLGGEASDWLYEGMGVGDAEPFADAYSAPGERGGDAPPGEGGGALEFYGEPSDSVAPGDPVAHAEIALSSTVSSGVLDAGVIEAAARRQRSAFESCYAREVARTGEPADGELELELTFRDRAVQRAEVTRATISVEMRRCLDRPVRRLALSAGEDGVAALTIGFTAAQ